MSKRALVVITLLAALAAPVSASAQDASAARKKTRLKAFSSCANLVDYAQRFGPRTVGAGMGTGGGRPMPIEDGAGGAPTSPESPQSQTAPVSGEADRSAGTDFSSTNVQEEGVDEPDTVKTNGKTIFVANHNSIHAVDARSAEPKLLGTLGLGDNYGHQLLLHSDRLLVISQASVAIPIDGGPGVARPATSVAYMPYRATTILTEVDISDPAAMKVLRTLEVDGFFLSARLNGSTARLVLNSPPRALDFQAAGAETVPEMRSAVRRARVRSWMPRAKLTHVPTGRELKRKVVACKSVRRAPAFSGLDMLTVATIDFSKGLHIIDSDAVMTNADIVYGSTKNLYVATQRWLPEDADPQRLARSRTLIHRFALTDSENTTYRASGEVPGYLLSQWALSEQDGKLRVASTTWPVWMFGEQPAVVSESESYVTVLDEVGGRLTQVGQVGGLGKGERIYAVRFIGDIGYVVTFRQVDPLYTVDVSDPTKPRVRGELKIPGYSAYLHPVGKDLLLGVGQDATEAGGTAGTQLSLFDVSDVDNPRQLHKRTLGEGSSSSVEFDHHAFLYWPASQLAVIPLDEYGRNGQQFAGAIGFRVGRESGITEVGRVQHEPAHGWRPSIDRSLVVGERLFTTSMMGLRTSALDTLAGQAWVPFPQPSGG